MEERKKTKGEEKRETRERKKERKKSSFITIKI